MKAILSVGFTSIQSLPICTLLGTIALSTASNRLTHFHDRTRLQSNHQNPISHSQYNSRPTFLHSWAHRLGLQRLASTMAIRVILSAIAAADREYYRDEGEEERVTNLK